MFKNNFKTKFSIDKPKIIDGQPVKLAPQILSTSKLKEAPKGKPKESK